MVFSWLKITLVTFEFKSLIWIWYKFYDRSVTILFVTGFHVKRSCLFLNWEGARSAGRLSGLLSFELNSAIALWKVNLYLINLFLENDLTQFHFNLDPGSNSWLFEDPSMEKSNDRRPKGERNLHNRSRKKNSLETVSFFQVWNNRVQKWLAVDGDKISDLFVNAQ